MQLNKEKTKVMLFNFFKKHKFTTNLQIDEETIEVVDQAKLLRVFITNDLKWDKNTDYLVKKPILEWNSLEK